MRNNSALNVAYAVRRNRRYGGRAGFADGGAPEDEGFPGVIRRVREATDPARLLPVPGPMTGSIRDDLIGSLPLASLGIQPRAVHLWPTPSGNRMQIRGRFASTNNPVIHAATEWYPAIAGSQIGANIYDQLPSTATAGRAPEAAARDVHPRDSFSDRFGEHAPPVDLSAMAMRHEPVDLTEFGAMGKSPEPEFGAMGKSARPAPRHAAPPVRREDPGLVDRILRMLAARKYGGRAGYDDGGLVEPEGEGFDAPLFLQSGLSDVPTPNEPVPMRNYRGRPVADWSQRDPEGAYEQSRERWGYMRDNPGETALGVGSVVAPVAGGIISSSMENAGDRAGERGVLPMGSPRRPAPRPEESSRAPLLAGVGSIFDMLGPSAAHGAEVADDPRPAAPVVDPTEKESAEIARMNAAIAGKRQELERATKANGLDNKGRPLPPSPRMTAATNSIAALQGDLARIEGPESPLGMRRRDAMSLYNDAVRRWEERQEKLSSRKTESQLPYAVKYPERQEWIQENMPKVSGMTGAALGLLGRGKVLKPLGMSLGAGAAEGAATAAWPTLQDAEFLPPGQTWGQAADRLRNVDPDFLTRVGAAAGTHALIAGGSSLVGSEARNAARQIGEGANKFRAWMKKPPPEPLTPPPPAGGPAAAPPVPSAPAPRPKTPPQIYHLPDGTQLKKYDFGSGGSRWMKDGKFIKASDAEALRGGSSMPSTAVHAPPSQARGGGIRSPAMNVAYAVRRQHRAEGGAVHAGPIMSAVPGRTDNHPMDVAEGSYVVPAESVSHLGENNTVAGMEVLNSMFGPESEIGRGASTGETSPVPINAAGGEFVIPPEVVSTIGGGDIKRGHEILDQWVMGRRKEHIKALRGLPGPAKS